MKHHRHQNSEPLPKRRQSPVKRTLLKIKIKKESHLHEENVSPKNNESPKDKTVVTSRERSKSSPKKGRNTFKLNLPKKN